MRTNFVILFCVIFLSGLRSYGANNADIYVSSSSIPTSIQPNEKKQVRIRVYNNGTTTWTSGSYFRLGAVSSGSNIQANSVIWTDFLSGGYMNHTQDGRVFLNANIYPGQYFDFAFSITALASATDYATLSVKMVQDGVEWFGESYAWNIPIDQNVSIPFDRWRLTIFNNRYLSGTPVRTMTDKIGTGGFTYDWGTGNPPNTGADNFSVRFERYAYFSGGDYDFATVTDDGVRLYVDNQLVITSWTDQAPTKHVGSKNMTTGWHLIRMDYYENAGGAYAAVTWSKINCAITLTNTGISAIAWPFANSQYVDPTHGTGNWYVTCSSGCGAHSAADYYADDWVTSNGTCNQEMKAPINGTVIYAGWASGYPGEWKYGNQVVIQSSQNSTFAFRVAHLDNISVSKNQYVTIGTKIGEVGTTGNSDGCHAHVVLYKNLNSTHLGVLGNGGWLTSFSNAAPFYFSVNCNTALKSAEESYTNKIVEESENNLVKLFPNPITSEANLRFELEEEANINVSIINAMGQVVDNPINNETFEAGEVNTALDVSHISNGIYFFQIEINERVYFKKAIIQ